MIFSFLLIFWASILPSSHTVTVEIVNIKNDKGQVLVSLFESEEGFPNNPDNAVAKQVATISNNKARLTFTGLAKGDYAIVVAHDENKNYKMDYNFIKIPKEGYGFSNDARGRMSAPSFQAASFNLSQASKTITITMSYVF